MVRGRRGGTRGPRRPVLVKGAKGLFFNGQTDVDGKPIDRGVIVPGIKAARTIKATVERRQAIKAERQ